MKELYLCEPTFLWYNLSWWICYFHSIQWFFGVFFFLFFFNKLSHESISGYYRTTSFFVSKVIFDLLPLRLIPTTIYACIAYFMMGRHPQFIWWEFTAIEPIQTSGNMAFFPGLDLSVEKFFIFYLTILLTTFVASSMAFLAGSLSPLYVVANITFMLMTIIMMVRESSIPWRVSPS